MAIEDQETITETTEDKVTETVAREEMTDKVEEAAVVITMTRETTEDQEPNLENTMTIEDKVATETTIEDAITMTKLAIEDQETITETTDETTDVTIETTDVTIDVTTETIEETTDVTTETIEEMIEETTEMIDVITDKVAITKTMITKEETTIEMTTEAHQETPIPDKMIET